jgi:hypothetical protein
MGVLGAKFCREEGTSLETKSFFVAMGLGAAAGTALGMMLPRNRTMEQMGRDMTSRAADTVIRAVDTVEKKMQ